MGMHFIKDGTAQQPALGGAETAIGLVGNPSLYPAFRVRRGKQRENGCMTGRARRATRPTPEQFSASMWAWRRLQLADEDAGHLRRPLRPALSRSHPLVRSSLGT